MGYGAGMELEKACVVDARQEEFIMMLDYVSIFTLHRHITGRGGIKIFTNDFLYNPRKIAYLIKYLV